MARAVLAVVLALVLAYRSAEAADWLPSNRGASARPPVRAGFAEHLLGRFLQEFLGKSVGVILGVGSGRLLLELLAEWPQSVLFLVDPYVHLQQGYDREENLDDESHQRQYEHLRNVLHDKPEMQGRFSFVRAFSFAVPQVWRENQRAADPKKIFHDANPSYGAEDQWAADPKFIFHDANPSYGAVRTDLHAWWPMLEQGGIMAGTNYTTCDDGSVVGVRRAVDEFADEVGLQVFVTSDPHEPMWLLLRPP